MLQVPPYRFLDAALQSQGALSDVLRAQLGDQLYRGTLQVLRVLSPEMSYTTADIEQVFSGVRVILSYGLFQECAGNLSLALSVLQRSGVFALAKSGAASLLSFIQQERVVTDPHPLFVLRTLHARKMTNKETYAYFCLGAEDAEKRFRHLLGRSDHNTEEYHYYQTVYQLLQKHNLVSVGLSLDVEPVETFATHVLLHRSFFSCDAPLRPEQTLRKLLSLPRDWSQAHFDDPDWQREHLPEFSTDAQRLRFCSQRATLQLLPDPKSGDPDRFRVAHQFWTSIASQSQMLEIEQLLNANAQLLPDWNEEEWAKAILAAGVGDKNPEPPITIRDSRLLLSRLRDQGYQKSHVLQWVNTFPLSEDQLTSFRRFADDLESETAKIRKVLTAIPGAKGRALERSWDEALSWLSTLYVGF